MTQVWVIRYWNLIVGHVAWSCTEFGVALDNFVDCFQEVFLCGHLASGADCEHACFGTDRTVIKKHAF